MSEEPELVCSREGAVLVARLNRPERRNALSMNLLNLLGEAAREAENSSDISVFLLTATGEKGFCSGMDLKDFAASGNAGGGDGDGMKAFMDLSTGRLKVPVVAAVNGAAVGGGFEILIGADVIVAAEHATFGLPEAKRGLFAAGSGMLLGTRIPMSVALEMALTGDPITAARAYELGMVNRVVPAADLMTSALDLAQRIAANGPLSLAATKELLRAACVDPEAAQARAAAWAKVVFSSRDAKEGATAFVEKRSPAWEGR